jgi:hypothetical protein
MLELKNQATPSQGHLYIKKTNLSIRQIAAIIFQNNVNGVGLYKLIFQARWKVDIVYV